MITYACDRCGKHVENEDYIWTIPYATDVSFDFCFDCRLEFYEWVTKYNVITVDLDDERSGEDGSSE